MNGQEGKLARCLSLVAEKSGLGDWKNWTKRDFEQLSLLIGQKTRIILSVSTLIRLYKGNSGQNPQKVTLDALARFVGFENWHSYSTCEDISHSQAPAEPSPAVRKPQYSRVLRLAGFAIIPITVFFGIWIVFFNQKIKPDEVRFRVINREITGLPATIQVEYDLGRYKPDQLWLQMYWNPDERVNLDLDQKHTSAIYCYPGVHICQLIADDQVVGKQEVYVKTSGWTALIRHTGRQLVPLYIRNASIIHDGVLQVTEPMVNTQNLEPNREIMTSYYYVNDFGPVYSDDYTISGRISNPPTTLGTQPCTYCTVYIIGENGKHFFTIGDLGCSALFKLNFSGEDTMESQPDLTAFEFVSGGWITFKSVVYKNNISISAGMSRIYSSAQVANVGKIKGIHFAFSGLGAIDRVMLTNSKGYLAMDEDFE